MLSLQSLMLECRATCFFLISSVENFTCKTVCGTAGLSDVDTDLEQIFLLAGHLLRTPQADGSVTARNIRAASSMKECLKTTSCSPTATFFRNEDVLKKCLEELIMSCANDELKLKEISRKMCSTLKEAPSLFVHKQYNVNNLKLRKDIHYENVAITAVSCHGTLEYLIPRYDCTI